MNGTIFATIVISSIWENLFYLIYTSSCRGIEHMGHQQLLLILVSVIVVVLAITIGLNLFSASAPEANRDHVISVLTSLSSDAHVYYKKEKQLGGGGDSYIGWKVPESFKKHENSKKKFIKAKVRENRIVFTGYGTEIGRNGKSPVRVRLVLKPTGTTMQIKN